jgi:hypothetical protein
MTKRQEVLKFFAHPNVSIATLTKMIQVETEPGYLKTLLKEELAALPTSNVSYSRWRMQVDGKRDGRDEDKLSNSCPSFLKMRSSVCPKP